jgi:hypothetical protein
MILLIKAEIRLYLYPIPKQNKNKRNVDFLPLLIRDNVENEWYPHIHIFTYPYTYECNNSTTYNIPVYVVLLVLKNRKNCISRSVSVSRLYQLCFPFKPTVEPAISMMGQSEKIKSKMYSRAWTDNSYEMLVSSNSQCFDSDMLY